MRIIITGAAGFIGSHLGEYLVEAGHEVIGIDNFDEFYSRRIKRRNLEALVESPRFELIELDILDADGVEALFAADELGRVDVLVHLAARAGVRPSIEQPRYYTRVNVEGTTGMLELARMLGVKRFVFASSSSVYGNSEKVQFSEEDPVERPISPYAAAKRAGELMCHTYHHLYGLSVVCLRFFTVYGPRQRPDLAIHKFTRLLAADDQSIPMYGNGSSERDYTYIDDILQGVEGAIGLTDSDEPLYEIINLGESETTSLARLIELISAELGIEPRIEQLPPQAGDVQRTFADISKARRLLDYAPRTKVGDGIPRFIRWFREAEDALGVPRKLI